MRTRLLSSLFCLLCLPPVARAEATSTATAPAAIAPLSTAVLDVEAADPALKPVADNLGLLLNAYLSTQECLILVERQQLASILGEQSIGASGLVNTQSSAKIGQLTGAKVLLSSRAFQQGKNLTLVTKIIGTETGRVFAEVCPLPPAGDKQNEAVQAFAAKLADIVRKNSGELVAKPEAADDRIARLTQLLTGRKLPSVSVNLTEQHLARHLIDPAAETEIANILGRLGFTLIAQGAATPADYAITGEAFSEAALRRGDFTSCRARVEIKVVATATDRIILQDRQTEVGIDLTESVAAKSALQKAGAQLADRIVAQFATLK